ncbi:hypothetical protein AZE42_09780 [Rhizopogon vesiculosus]|uniref:Uncharacterized protein n=1 Tax=Rhizopogon vesiculosus TaxID=180088 RepID=A0A1J8QTL8_9AGAM|nr:hypothetical protein AZE42_09780 [Rhizopogon vesiculosus]
MNLKRAYPILHSPFHLQILSQPNSASLEPFEKFFYDIRRDGSLLTIGRDSNIGTQIAPGGPTASPMPFHH